MKALLIENLLKLGLSKKEAKVYLASIESGTAPVSKIAILSGINRVTTYDILDKLKKKGLVSFYTKNKIRYFTGIKPQLLIDQFEKRTLDLKESLPKFKEFIGNVNVPKVRYFEGLDGVKSIYADSLTSKTEILNYSNYELIRKVWPEYEKEYIRKRAKKKIFLKGIAVDDRKVEVIKKDDARFYRETRIMGEFATYFMNEILVFDNKYAVINLGDEIMGVVIESQEVADSHRIIFELAWNSAGIGIFDDPELLKRKMFMSLSGTDLHRSIVDQSKPLTIDKKEVKEDNLSLF